MRNIRSTFLRISLGLVCACHSDSSDESELEPTSEFPVRCNPTSDAVIISFMDEKGEIAHEVTVSCGQHGNAFSVTPELDRGEAFLLRLNWSRFEISRFGVNYAVLELTNPGGLQLLAADCGVVFIDNPRELLQARCLIPEELVALDSAFIELIAGAFAIEPGTPRGIECCRPGVAADLMCECIPPERVSMPSM